MIIPLEPRLEGLAERRFFSFARRMLARQARDPGRIGKLVEDETTRLSGLDDLRGQSDEYEACVRVLGDLAQLRWTLVESGYGLELHSPRPQDKRVSGPAQARERKEAIRKELRPRLLQQFADPNVGKFIHRMEHPPASARRQSIRALIADGAELQARLSVARRHPAGHPARTAALGQAVRPYLQLVDAGRDGCTNIQLRDIWRYFRYTWSIPQTPIPGRSLFYLVRDAAHEAHAVIGIAALSNCAVQLAPRDRAIGWSAAGLEAALETLFAPPKERRRREAVDPALRFHGIYRWLKRQSPDGVELSPAARREALERVIDWLLAGVSTAIDEIERRGLATDAEIAAPTRQVVEHLRHRSREFASRRQKALARPRDGDDPGASHTFSTDVPVDDDVLELEDKHLSNAQIQESRRMLVRKKRAFELARLLDARRVLDASRDALTDPATALRVIQEQDEVRTAVNAAMSAIKGRRIGTNLLDITTCGAVAPYNRMLGGKLVALLLLSPQVAADNQRRYGGEPTIIRSQLRNARVVPDNTLVWLGTTSLFAHGSSQYERLRLPAGTIAPDQPEIRYTYLGDTTGYGTVQFADDTVRALDGVLRGRRGYRDVNGIFGEGASPRLRKLRSGLDAIGFRADLTMLHHQERRIYGVPLLAEAGAYLCGIEPDLPDYVARPEAHADATERIAEYWRRRWLSSRLEHGDSWAALGEARPWLLSATAPLPAPPSSDVGGGSGGAADGGGPEDESRLAFWRRLARAGSNAVSEGLTDAEFEALHLATPLEDYLLERARDRVSIVLTGNAGDGKTHLARTLQRRLEGDADRLEFAFDATAMMSTEEGVAPIVDRWRQAENAGKGMVLAINQYPLYMLRRQFPDALPELSESIERQWKARLTGDGGAMADGDSVLLVDLSLRNPLSGDFASRVLQRLLSDPSVRRHAERGADRNFSLNFERLANPRVQDRLFGLFDRVISSGRRATVRELWILTARLLFGTSEDEAGDEVPDAPRAWYSERLFAPDARFPLSAALRGVSDPAGISHPHVDRCLEDPDGIKAVEWLAGSEPPLPLPSPVVALGPGSEDRERYRTRFLALKRRFYFEHVDGGENVFRLDHGSHARFHELLRTPEDDEEHLSVLIEAINRCYFPHHFDGVKDKLCLWIGHRLDEQPTKSFVAGECIPRERLCIRRPEPPGALKDALAFVPDHLVLTEQGRQGDAPRDGALRIDAALFHALWAVKGGLPRHLIDPGELNRLDTFVDRLRHGALSPLPYFLIYNAEHVTSSAVKMSTGFDRFVSARRL